MGVAQADVMGWACFVVGVSVLLAGVAVGLSTSLKRAPRKAREAKAKMEEARSRIEEARGHIQRTTSAVAESGLESPTVGAAEANAAAEAAGESTAAAQTALEQLRGIVASLPENLRFAGLLVLVGTVLMGVATVQFGGVSLF
jgi:gas vesicle protein